MADPLITGIPSAPPAEPITGVPGTFNPPMEVPVPVVRTQDEAVFGGGPLPSPQEALRQASLEYASAQAARKAAATTKLSTTNPYDDILREETPDPYAPYKQNTQAHYELYEPGNAVPKTTTDIKGLLSEKVTNPNLEVSVFDTYGIRQGVKLDQLDTALRSGYKLENLNEASIRRYVDDNKGLAGSAKVFLENAGDTLLLGVPEIIWRHRDPEGFKKFEAMREKHPVARYSGAALGVAGSLLYGGEVAAGAKSAEAAVASVLYPRLINAGLEEGASAISKGLARTVVERALRSGVTLGMEGAAYGAPAAVTEAALGDPKQAAETMVYSIGLGAGLGAIGGSAKGAWQHLKQINSTNFSKLEERAFKALSDDPSNYEQLGDEMQRLWDQKYGKRAQEGGVNQGVGGGPGQPPRGPGGGEPPSSGVTSVYPPTVPEPVSGEQLNVEARLANAEALRPRTPSEVAELAEFNARAPGAEPPTPVVQAYPRPQLVPNTSPETAFSSMGPLPGGPQSGEVSLGIPSSAPIPSFEQSVASVAPPTPRAEPFVPGEVGRPLGFGPSSPTMPSPGAEGPGAVSMSPPYVPSVGPSAGIPSANPKVEAYTKFVTMASPGAEPPSVAYYDRPLSKPMTPEVAETIVGKYSEHPATPSEAAELRAWEREAPTVFEQKDRVRPDVEQYGHGKPYPQGRGKPELVEGGHVGPDYRYPGELRHYENVAQDMFDLEQLNDYLKAVKFANKPKGHLFDIAPESDFEHFKPDTVPPIDKRAAVMAALNKDQIQQLRIKALGADMVARREMNTLVEQAIAEAKAIAEHKRLNPELYAAPEKPAGAGYAAGEWPAQRIPEGLGGIGAIESKTGLSGIPSQLEPVSSGEGLTPRLPGLRPTMVEPKGFVAETTYPQQPPGSGPFASVRRYPKDPAEAEQLIRNFKAYNDRLDSYLADVDMNTKKDTLMALASKLQSAEEQNIPFDLQRLRIVKSVIGEPPPPVAGIDWTDALKHVRFVTDEELGIRTKLGGIRPSEASTAEFTEEALNNLKRARAKAEAVEMNSAVQANVEQHLTELFNWAARFAQAAVGGLIGHRLAGDIGGLAGVLLGSEKSALAKGVAKRIAKIGSIGEVGAPAAHMAEAAAAKVKQDIDISLKDYGPWIETAGKRIASGLPAVPSRGLVGNISALIGRHEVEESKQEAFKRAQQELTSNAAISKRVDHLVGPFAQGGIPKVAAAMKEKYAAAYDYLRKTMPKDNRTPDPLRALTKWTPSNAQLAEWNSRLDVAVDPMSVLRHTVAGTLTKAHIEALDSIWPDTANAIKQRVMEVVSTPEAQRKLTYNKREQIKLLIGVIPSDVGELQAVHAEAQGGKAKSSGGNSAAGQSTMTDTQRVEFGQPKAPAAK